MADPEQIRMEDISIAMFRVFRMYLDISEYLRVSGILRIGYTLDICAGKKEGRGKEKPGTNYKHLNAARSASQIGSDRIRSMIRIAHSMPSLAQESRNVDLITDSFAGVTALTVFACADRH